MKPGFVDLRLNGSHSGEESFWPSFTDIMMVIVLIFLMAMVTLLVKNMNLVHQLRASLAAEREATMQVRSTANVNTALNQRLNRLEEEASMLRLRLMNLGEEHSHSMARLKSTEQENIQLKARLSELTVARDTALNEKRELEKNQAELTATLHQRENELQKRQQELLTQQQQYQLKLTEIATIKASSQTQQSRLGRLESEYASLQTKYNKLIRPARSSLGKYVVMVRYRKQGGQLRIGIKLSADSAYVHVSGIELQKRLVRLHKQHGKKLYVRIIFPDDSGLSYTEAWKLTESLLRKYDYYYRK